MKKTLVLALSLSLVCVHGRLAGVFDFGGEVDAKLRGTVESAGYRVVGVSPEGLLDAKFLSGLDLLILPNASRFPVVGLIPFRTFIESGKDVLFLGPQPFSELTILHNGNWMNLAERYDNIKASSYQRVEFPEATAWSRACHLKEIPSELTIENGTFSYKLQQLRGWDSYGTTISLPAGTDILRVEAKGSENTTKFSVEITEKDGSRWVAVKPLTTSWQTIVAIPQDFRFWRDCRPSRPRGHEGDLVRMEECQSIVVGLSDTHTKGLKPGEQGFQLRNLGALKAQFPVVDSKNELPNIETFYPPFKQVEILDKPGHFHTPVRFCGRGINQNPRWRWNPFVVKNGKLIPENSLLTMRHIWMTILLDGPTTASRSCSRLATIAAPVKLDDPEYLEVVALLCQRLNQQVELIGGGTDKYGLFAEQQLQLGAEVLFMDDEALAKGAIVKAKLGKTTMEFRTSPDNGRRQRLAGEVTGLKPDTSYTATAELWVDGVLNDAIEHEVNVVPSRETLASMDKERIRVVGDNFMLAGKPWYPVGINLFFTNMACLDGPDYLRGTMAVGFYDPKLADKDLDTMAKLGINMAAIHLQGDTHREKTYNNLLDFFTRCRRRNIYVMGYIRSADPKFLNEGILREVVGDSGLTLFPTLFAIDTSWEPGNYWFRDKNREWFDRQWRTWVADRYGSEKNAMADWAFEPRRDKDGKLVSPSNDQLVHDGDWRVYVAAYRRFMDDETSAMWNKSASLVRRIAPYQLVSFRQGNTLPQDFALTGPVAHLDFICPEAYTINHSEDGYDAAGFITRLINHTGNGKPIVWMEFGKAIWNMETMKTDFSRLDEVADYHKMIYEMVLETGANGTAPWWWPGGYRVNEGSDCGITNADASPRPAALMLKHYAPLLKKPRTRPVGDILFEYDRDAHAGGYCWLAFNAGKDAYRAARKAGKQLRFKTLATGTTSATVPLIAVGNVPCTGTNPPKYLNAEINGIQVKDANGQWKSLDDQIILPEGTAPIEIRLDLLNLGEATWIAPKNLTSPASGDVVVLSNGEVAGGIEANAPRFGKVMTKPIVLKTEIGKPQVFSLKLAAYDRTSFGPSILINYDKAPSKPNIILLRLN
jgi:hypothetical protein